MRIAVFSDIHGNKHALEAVLADIQSREPDLLVCLGDLVGYGADPDAVVQAIRASGIPTVMGNYDDAIANRRLVCGCDYKDEKALEAGVKSISWTMEHTREASREFLLTLPDRIVKTINGRRVLFVHGSPRKLNEYLYEDVPAADIIPMLREANVDVLVCGHTHLPYHRVAEDRHIINAGSAGKPKHGDPQAVYALIELSNDIRVEFIKVPYDYESAALAVEKAGLPAEFAAILRTGIG
ncbi:phosphoesterase, MJ0936 family [Desulfotomaculum arcticum]|uniref:Phosphoesterase n=1 Tax=Desulfotruncus arcticus DSM 17038 TaxID=1121424 RepID=A0A1I2V0G5_9FIRM|nr:metallophosphoesterase family protein [Desulfotruncus arcticus]SFG81657.1 phosphoesterase, MJ0936 family [Desulfotomaculum arcticum] [Desulfotruncus arcticus DSM 17038]